MREEFMGFKFNDQNIHHDNVKLLDAQSGVSWDGHIKYVKLSVGCEYKAIKAHSVSKKTEIIDVSDEHRFSEHYSGHVYKT